HSSRAARKIQRPLPCGGECQAPGNRAESRIARSLARSLHQGTPRRPLRKTLSRDFDRIHLGHAVVHRRELNQDLTGRYGNGEGLVNRFEGSSSHREHIEVREDCTAVDSNVERALSGGGEEDLREFQGYLVASVGHRESVTERSLIEMLALIDIRR